jgi:hypothetical protein
MIAIPARLLVSSDLYSSIMGGVTHLGKNEVPKLGKKIHDGRFEKHSFVSDQGYPKSKM